MWPLPKKDVFEQKIPLWTAVALIISTLSLSFAAGTARWSWLILEEQISLREDFMNLKASQDQLGLQYDFWSKQLQQERDAMKQ